MGIIRPMPAQPLTNWDRAASEYVQDVAKRKGVNQGELADLAGISRNSIGAYWRGQVPMTVGTVIKLLVALKSPLDKAMDEITRRGSDLDDAEK